MHELTDGATTPYLAPYCAWLSFATYLTGTIWCFTDFKKISKKD
jgi:benzodiazapine receptor